MILRDQTKTAIEQINHSLGNIAKREEKMFAKLDQMTAALTLIEGIASGSRTANSLPHIANIARAALGDTK